MSPIPLDVKTEKNIDAGLLEGIRVGLTYNLKKDIVTDPPDMQAEFDDFDTILAIKNALQTGGCEVELFEADENLPLRLTANRPDIVFNIAEGIGERGREAQIPALLNFLNIPYTGSDETAMCIAMDKALAKRLLSSYRIRTPKYRVVSDLSRAMAAGLSFPVIVKPNAEGSSKGISGVSVVNNADELKEVLKKNIGAYKQDMLVEEYIEGREFTVGILGNGSEMRVFPPMEIIFKDKDHGIYSYEVKRDFKKYIEYECPPDISARLIKELEDTAMKIYKILGCRDCARTDFRLSRDGKLYFIEVNPLPGLAPGYSDFPMLAEFSGVEYDELVQGILISALKRYGLNKNLDGDR